MTVLLAAGWLLLAGTLFAATTRDGRPATVRLELAANLAPDLSDNQESASFLREDQNWLGRMDAALLWLPTSTAPDSLARWVRRVAEMVSPEQEPAGPAGQTDVGPARDLLSLLRQRWLQRGFLAVGLSQRLESSAAELSGDRQHLGTGSSPVQRVIGIVTIDPGPRFHLGNLLVEGLDFPGRARLIDAYLPRPGDRYRQVVWQEAVTGLLLGAGELGYPYAHWLVRRVVVDSVAATVDLDATLVPGKQATFGRQTCSLTSERGQRFLARASGLRRGNRFRESELARAQRRLQERGIYSYVGEPLIFRTASRDTVDVHWPVTRRRKANRLAVVLGLSQRQEGESSRISGQVDLLLPNLADTGRRLQGAWSDNGTDRTHLGFGFLEPLAFGTPLDAELELDNEVVTDSYTRFRLDGRFQLPVVASWGIEVGVGWDRSTFPTGYLERTSRVRGRGAFLHRRGDLTRSGWTGLFAVETARRQATTRRDTTATTNSSQLGRVELQRLLEFDLEGELWLRPVWSVAVRCAYRNVSGEGVEIPLAEQYRFGGARTVRGYREDEFRGESILFGSLELRIGRAGRSRLYTFFDMGYFQFSASAPLPEDPEHREDRDGSVRGFGLGLQTSTPGGDISLAIGFPGSVNFDDAKLHVSLLEAF
ncbi:MAG: BamA/TamA family outer membrane protein [bacterium]